MRIDMIAATLIIRSLGPGAHLNYRYAWGVNFLLIGTSTTTSIALSTSAVGHDYVEISLDDLLIMHDVLGIKPTWEMAQPEGAKTDFTVSEIDW